MSYTVQHKRSDTVDRRPLPAELENGQVAINYNNDSPGLFFKTSTGVLTKAGPCTVSATQPTTPTNYTNFAVGELWLDTSEGVLKVWSGTTWVDAGEGARDLIPVADSTYNLGSPSNRWANIYTGDVQLNNSGSSNEVDGTWGSYTIQEGENDLFLINRRSGKKYRFALEEVK